MLPDGSIRADRLWKRFRADRRRALLTEEFRRLRAHIGGDRDRFWRWAIRDVSLDVAPGEAVGLIGANGSGKSTLLKLLTQVMYPYAGSLEVAGRVGALIEVSAGIHPELSGRENAYLYGSLLGQTRTTVRDRLDEIVAFAELDAAVDRQVKFYSSGMKMRLGFAVAALLNPDILLVDEVLAVGDASFQQKCLDRMRSILAEGTTLVFVSHDLAAVQATCTRGLWLHDGVVAGQGDIDDVLGSYRQSVEEAAEAAPRVTGPIELLKISVAGDTLGVARTQGPLDISFVLSSDQPRSAAFHIGISEGPASPIFSIHRDIYFGTDDVEARCHIKALPLARGRYYLWVGAFGGGKRDLLAWHPAAHFDVLGPDLDAAPRAVARLAPVHVDADWNVETT